MLYSYISIAFIQYTVQQVTSSVLLRIRGDTMIHIFNKFVYNITYLYEYL